MPLASPPPVVTPKVSPDIAKCSREWGEISPPAENCHSALSEWCSPEARGSFPCMVQRSLTIGGEAYSLPQHGLKTVLGNDNVSRPGDKRRGGRLSWEVDLHLFIYPWAPPSVPPPYVSLPHLPLLPNMRPMCKALMGEKITSGSF